MVHRGDLHHTFVRKLMIASDQTVFAQEMAVELLNRWDDLSATQVPGHRSGSPPRHGDLDYRQGIW